MPLTSDIQAYIDNAANQYGVDPGLMSVIAQIESGGNPNARAGSSSAAGLFQFTSGTAAQYGLANPFDPQQSSNAAAQLIRDNYNSLSSVLGTAPTDWQQYLAYQQGTAGAKALLTADPSANAIQALQQGVKGMSATTAYQSVVNNLGGNYKGDPASATVGDFLGYWQNMYQSKASGSTAGTYTGLAGQSVAGANQQFLGNNQGFGLAGKAADAATGWVGSIESYVTGGAARVALFVLGAVFVLGGLYLFDRGQAQTVVQKVTPQ